MKKGRKQQHFIDRFGNPIVGLSKQPDGRYRIIGTAIRFTEPDESKAIKRFRELTNQTTADGYDPTMSGNLDEQGRLTDSGVANLNGGIRFGSWQMVWDWLAIEIRERPLRAAKKLGIEQIGYLMNLKAPEPLPPIAELKSLWIKHAPDSTRRKVIQAVDEFFAIAKVNDLREIINKHSVDYRNWSLTQNWSPKTQSHRYNYLRTFFRFLSIQDVAPEVCKNILASFEKLKPTSSTASYDPQPIEVKDFRKLLKAANDSDKAMLLLMLNGCMYIQEVIRVKWSDIDGNEYIGNREKKGKVLRVAVLWKETLAALKKLPKHEDGYIFRNYRNEPLGISGSQKRFLELAEAANVSVTASQLRDGAYTVAFDLDEKLAMLLAGHKTKSKADHYVKRNPSMVRPACEAVYKKYMKA